MNKEVMAFIYKVGVPTGFAIVLLYYVLSTTAVREEKLMNVIKENQIIMQTQSDTIKCDIVTLRQDVLRINQR